MKTLKRIIYITAIVAAVALAVYFQGNSTTFSAEPVVIEERDNIQKLTDNFAEAYRVLVEAEEQYLQASSTLEQARTVYDEAVWNINTFTK